jgi:hypothetical protein
MQLYLQYSYTQSIYHLRKMTLVDNNNVDFLRSTASNIPNTKKPSLEFKPNN